MTKSTIELRIVTNAGCRYALPALFLAILLGSVAVRGLAACRPTLFQDEAFTWRLTQKPLSAALRDTIEDGHAPLYTIICWCSVKCGSSDVWMLRLPSLLAGILTVALAGYVAHQFVNWGNNDCSFLRPNAQVLNSRLSCSAAVVAMGLLTTNELQIWNSSTARMYAIATLFVLGSTSAFVAAAARGWTKGRHVWYIACAIGAVYTHHFAWFVIMGHWLSGVIFYLARNRGWRTWAPHFEQGVLISAICIVGAYLPWLPITVAQASEVQRGYWIPDATAEVWQETIARAYVGTAPHSHNSMLLLALGAALSAGVAYSRPAVGVILLPAALITIVGLVVQARLGQTLLQERYLSFSSAHWALLVSVGIFAWPNRIASGLLALAILLPSVEGAMESRRIRIDSTDARQMACQWLARKPRLSTTIIVSEPKDVNLLRYYLAHEGTNDIRVVWLMPHRWPLGHVVHVASLEKGEVWIPEHEQSFDGADLWCLYEGEFHLNSRSPLKPVEVHKFEGVRSQCCFLARLERPKINRSMVR